MEMMTPPSGVEFMGANLYPTLEAQILAADALAEGECYAVSRDGSHWKTGYSARKGAIYEARLDWGWRQIITARVTAIGLVDLGVDIDPDIVEDAGDD